MTKCFFQTITWPKSRPKASKSRNWRQPFWTAATSPWSRTENRLLKISNDSFLVINKGLFSNMTAIYWSGSLIIIFINIDSIAILWATINKSKPYHFNYLDPQDFGSALRGLLQGQVHNLRVLDSAQERQQALHWTSWQKGQTQRQTSQQRIETCRGYSRR